MAISFDTAAAAALGTVDPSFTITATGSNRAILVGKVGTKTAGLTATYNGVSMTQIGQAVFTGPCNSYVTVFYLANPASGLNTVQFGGDDANGTIYYNAVTYAGVDQGGTVDNTNTTTQGTGITNTNTLTPSAANCWHIAFFLSGSAGQSANVGTQRTITTAAFGTYDTNGPITAGIPDALIVNQTNQCGQSLGVTLAPAGAGAVTTIVHGLGLLGVGS